MKPEDTDLSITRRDVVAIAGGLAGGLAALGASASAIAASSAPIGQWPSYLYPHESTTRATRDLSGVWQFRLDPKDEGEAANWQTGVPDTRPIAVPASWNDLFDDARNYFGTAWYQTEFFVDAAWRERRIHLRFGSANYRAKVWLNGKLIGEHVGGHLPFAFDVSAAITMSGANRLVVLVENKLTLERVPSASNPSAGFSFGGYPAVTFDFFPYAGLHRPVLLFATPAQFIDDVTVRTGLEGGTGVVDLDISVSGNWTGTANVVIEGNDQRYTTNVSVRNGRVQGQLKIPAVRPWHPDDPFLYSLVMRLGGAAPMDEYRLKVGVRTVEVKSDQLLLNGKPIFLTGFGKHEDFPIHGRGLDIPVIVRDFELLKWIGANSFRTSHYPYSDEAMQLADEYGLLVIDETPAVSLGFGDTPEIIEARRVQLAQALRELIARDKNHPCVIAWSLANEPGLNVGANNAERSTAMVEAGATFFKPLFDYTRKTDPTRPVVLVGVGSGPDEWVGLGDFICVNLYYGWYYGGLGQLEEVAGPALDKEIQRLRARHGKPIMVTEFGADTLPGKHAQPPEMWSEEYQAQMMEVYMSTLRQHSYVIGAHPWAFTDFKTSQGVLRAAGLNHKGIFTREREPKLAAHKLRELWRTK